MQIIKRNKTYGKHINGASAVNVVIIYTMYSDRIKAFVGMICANRFNRFWMIEPQIFSKPN